MSDKYRNNRLTAVIILLILGVILALFPGGTLELLCRIAGIAALCFGAATLIGALRENQDGMTITVAVVAIVAGIFFAARPGVLASFIPFVMGIVLLANSILNLSNAVRNRDLMGNRFWYTIIGAAATMVLSIIILLNSFFAASVMVRIIGIGLIVGAVDSLVTMKK